MATRGIVFVTSLVVMAQVTLGQSAATSSKSTAKRPNILWITAEDMSPNLGCYGDTYAATPHLDELARESVRMTHVFATAPVCSPARSCLFTGVYATTLGTQRLRSHFPLPPEIIGFPTYLRRAGYFTSNNVKTDYNVAREPELIAQAWDQNSSTAHWRQRKPGQPFFSVFNLMTTHQSRSNVWPESRFESEVASRLSSSERHRPEQATIPPYYPDTPIVRKTLARYYDCISVMDKQVAELLEQLREDGLDESTLVFFFADHGMGMPRGKRLLHDSGMHVPLLIRCPKAFQKWQVGPAGSTSRKLVSFVDLPPTVLSVAGVEIPSYMQGRPFLGADASGNPRELVYGARDRVDEAFDLSRSVRNHRFLYIRNFMPHYSWMQPEWYSDQAELRQHLTELRVNHQLERGPMTYAASRRQAEELYDVQADPYQLVNLANQQEHKDTLDQLGSRLRAWQIETQDVGCLPESNVWARLRQTKDASSPWELARIDRGLEGLADIWAAADRATRDGANFDECLAMLENSDAAIRYWGVTGLHAMARGSLNTTAKRNLTRLLSDRDAAVRIATATALIAADHQPSSLDSLIGALTHKEADVVLHATRSLEQLGRRADGAQTALHAVLRRARESRREDPNWLFVEFSADATLRRLQPNAVRAPVSF